MPPSCPSKYQLFNNDSGKCEESEHEKYAQNANSSLRQDATLILSYIITFVSRAQCFQLKTRVLDPFSFHFFFALLFVENKNGKLLVGININKIKLNLKFKHILAHNFHMRPNVLCSRQDYGLPTAPAKLMHSTRHFVERKKIFLADRRIYSSWFFILFSSSSLPRNGSRFPYQYWHIDAEHSHLTPYTPASSEMIRMRTEIRCKSIRRDKENCNLLCHGTTHSKDSPKTTFCSRRKPKRTRKMLRAMHTAKKKCFRTECRIVRRPDLA